MKRVYFGLVPKNFPDAELRDFFARLDPQLQGFYINKKLLTHNFGYFETVNSERILRQNGLKTLGFVLKVRPCTRENYAYQCKQPVYGHEDEVAIWRLRAREREQRRAEELWQWAERAFQQQTPYNNHSDDEERSASVGFDAIPRRVPPQEYRGQKRARRAILPRAQ